jgi:hypothetical protein
MPPGLLASPNALHNFFVEVDLVSLYVMPLSVVSCAEL